MAGKYLTCVNRPGEMECVVAGPALQTISNGTLATVVLKSISTRTESSNVSVQVQAATAEGAALPFGGTSAIISVVSAAPPALKSLTCSPTTIDAGAKATCLLTLQSAAPTTGAVALLSTDALTLTAPATVDVAPGAMSVQFAVTAPTLPALTSTSLTASLGTSSVSTTVNVQQQPAVSSLSCAPAVIQAGSKSVCTLHLDKAAPAGGFTTTLTSSSPNVSIPGSVFVAAGASAATFTATSNASAPVQTVTLTASSARGKKTVSLSLTLPSLSVICPDSIRIGQSVQCSVTLPVASVSRTVTLVSSSRNLTIPASVHVPAAASSAVFPASASGAVVNTELSVITAASGTATASTDVLLVVETKFLLSGMPAEFGGLVNGSLVHPVAPFSAEPGRLIVSGTGYLNFSAGANNPGMQFLQGGQQSENSAFVQFTGAGLSTLFGSEGSISFSLKSNVSFAERLKSSGRNYQFVYDVFDETNRQFIFMTYTQNNQMMLAYSVRGDTLLYYALPNGFEDKMFGNGITLNVRLSWTAAEHELYVNGELIRSAAYVAKPASWGTRSALAIGSQNARVRGGYSSLTDTLSNFRVD